MEDRRSKRRLILKYTLVFVITFVCVFSFFVSYGKSFVWKKDGLYQHFNAFVYFGQYVRDFFRTIFFEHRLELKMWEPGLGYGADVFTTLSYYSFGDPFAFIAVFFRSSACEIGYSLSIILRFYAAGLSFILYCFNRGKRGTGVLCGAILYAFCSFSLFAGVRHPYFLNPMIYLPLLFLGVDRIKRNESPVVYILAVFVSAISNFYFLYMLVLLTVIYVVVRTLCDRKERTPKMLFKRVCVYAGYGLLGIMMASILFIPNALNFLDNERITGVYRFSPVYSIFEYAKLLVSFMGTDCGPFWSYVGLAPVAYFGAFCFLHKKGKGLWQKVFLIVMGVLLLLPVAGFVFNGFGYVCNRWVFAWSFIISYLFVEGYDTLLDCPKDYFKPLLKCSLIYIGLSLICSLFISPEVYIQSLFIVFILSLVALAPKLKDFSIKRHLIKASKVKQFVSVCLVCASVFSMGIYRYSDYARAYLSTFRDIGTAYDLLTGERAKTFALIKDSGNYYRIDNNTYDNYQANYMPAMKHSTTSVYFSLINPYISQYARENSLYFEAAYEQRGLNNRSYLLPLAAVKYYVTDNNKALIPYGFEPVGDEKYSTNKYYLYKNKNSLPMVYGYDSFCTYEEYNELPCYRKQQMLLESAVIESEASKDVPLDVSNTVYLDKEMSTLKTVNKGANFDGKKIIVDRELGYIKFDIETVKDAEVYVYFKGLKYHSKQFTNSEITASLADARDNVFVFTERDMYAEDRKEHMLNLGINNDSNEIRLTFSNPGEYTFEKMSIVALPVKSVSTLTNALRVDIENELATTNEYSVKINNDKQRLICLSIPYSKGFRAYVDGVEVPLYRVNTMFMGVMCGEGKHIIRVKYVTPNLKLGIKVSFVGIGLFILIALYYSTLGKKKEKEK